MHQKHTNHIYPAQRGAAIVETCLVCIPLWLVCTLVLELTYSQSVRQIAQLALYEAARTGSVTGAHPAKIKQTFSQAILPLFVPAGPHDSPATRRDTSVQKVFDATGLSLWHLETLNPDSAVYTDFADPDLSRALNRPALRNDYLAQQHAVHIKKGWRDGRGPVSGQTVFNANTLRLQLSLLYRPRAPGIAFILKKLGAHRSDRTGLAWQKGYLEAKLVTEVMMQSHAQQWHAFQKNDSEASKQAGPQAASQKASSALSRQIQQYPSGMHPSAHSYASRLAHTGQTSAPEISQETTQKNTQETIPKTAGKDAADSHASIGDNELCNGLLCCQ